jgi:hypothetical protein
MRGDPARAALHVHVHMRVGREGDDVQVCLTCPEQLVSARIGSQK